MTSEPPRNGRSEAIRASGSPPRPATTSPQIVRGSEPEIGRDAAATIPAPPVAVTQTRPSPTASPRGVPPTGIVRATALSSGSIRTTVPRTPFVAQNAPAPTAMSETPSPTGIADGLVFGSSSIRQRLPSGGAVTHTDPAPTASAPNAVARRRTRRPSRFVTGSIRVTVPSVPIAQTSRPAAAIAVAAKPWTPPTRALLTGQIREMRESGPITHTTPSDGRSRS